MPSLRIYSPLDLRFPDISARTGLYPLRPVGLGTPMVESLTSYITRLAQAHDVSTRTLIAEYLRFHLPRAQVADALQDKDWDRHFLDYAHTLNGMMERVDGWILALEAATGAIDLRYSDHDHLERNLQQSGSAAKQACLVCLLLSRLASVGSGHL